MDFKQKVVNLVSEQVDLPKEKISMLIERPKNPKMGDYAFPTFALAKIEHKNPALIAKDIAEKIDTKVFDSKIRQGVAIEAAQADQIDIFTAAPKSGVASDYESFCNELMNDILKENQ